MRIAFAQGYRTKRGSPGGELPPAPDPVFNLGVNLAGWEFGDLPGTIPNDYSEITPLQLDYYVARNVNRFRIPIKWERLQPVLNGPLDTTQLNLMKTLAAGATERGVKVMWDLHNYARYKVGGVTTAILGAGVLTGEHLADFWGKMALEFRGNSGVYGYDLMNEPHTLSNPGDWKDAAQLAVNAIRAVDLTTAIYVEGYHYSSAAQWRIYNEDLHIFDPSNNLLYSAHCYQDRNNSGTHFIWAEEVAAGDELTGGPLTDEIGVERISVFVSWLNLNGYRGHIGELGTGSDSEGWNDALRKTLTYSRSQNLDFSLWGAGEAWSSTYGYRLNPVSGKQAKQMVVIDEFTPYTGPQPMAYYLSGPTRGSNGVPSAPFTAEYRGRLTASLVVVPTDGGRGGTFTPATLTLLPGGNAYASFTYTAPGAATYAIGLTNSDGFTAPPDSGYGTFGDRFTTNESTFSNILSLRRIFAPYIGPAIRLRRASDGLEQDFYFENDHGLPRQDISDWSLNSTLTLVQWYDQSPRARHARKVFLSQNQGASSVNDYPTFQIDGGDGYPALRWTGSDRMDATSPIQGTAHTWHIHMNHTSGNRAVAWEFTRLHNFPGTSGTGWNTTEDSPVGLALATVVGAWHSYSGRWQAAAVNGKQGFYDGALSVSQTTTAPEIYTNTQDGLNLGHFRFGTPKWTGSMRELVVYKGAMSDALIAGLHTDLRAYYDAAPPPPVVVDNTVFPHAGSSVSANWIRGAYSSSNVAGDGYTSRTAASFSSGTTTTAGLDLTAGRIPSTYIVQAFTGTSGRVNMRLVTLTGGGNRTIVGGLGNARIYKDASGLIAITDGTLSATQSLGSGTWADVTVEIEWTSTRARVRANGGSWASLTRTGLGPIGDTSVMRIGSKADGSEVAGAYMPELWNLPATVPFTAPASRKGVNLTGAELNQGTADARVNFDYTYATNALIDYYYAAGARLIRFPLAPDRLQPRKYQEFNAAEVARVNRVVQYAASKGMWIILEPHSYGRLRDDSGTIYRVGLDPQTPPAMLADWWTRFSWIYRDQPNVIFNLMNEPHFTLATTWRDTALLSIVAIRANGCTQLIAIPGENYTGAHSWNSTADANANNNGLAWGSLSATDIDPLNNFCFDMHQYLDSNNAGDDNFCVLGKGATCLISATTWLESKGFKAMLGEFAWSTANNCPVEGPALMNYLTTKSATWIGWSYWGDGNWQSSSDYKDLGPVGGADSAQLNTLKTYF